MKRRARFLGCVCAAFLLTVPALAAEETPPNAVDDYVETEQKTTHIYVLDNDTAGGDTFDPATLSIVSSPSHGDAVVIAKGAVRIKYMVAASGPLTDRFRYSICTTAGLCATAAVIVNYLAPSTTTSPPDSTTSTTNPPPDSATSTTSTTVEAGPPPTTGPAEQADADSGPGEDSTDSETESATPPATEPPDGPHALDDLMGDSASRSDGITNPPGTTIGERNVHRFEADMLYLGRTGKDTLRMVAAPALMVSGLVGFLMVGLPQNASGAALGFLVAFRRKRRPEPEIESGASA